MEAKGETYNGEIGLMGRSYVENIHRSRSLRLHSQILPRSYCRAVSVSTAATARKQRAKLLIGGIILGGKAQETDGGSELYPVAD